MVIAYLLGKFEEERREINWITIIEGGIFEFFQRLILTDLKPQIFHKIEKDEKKYAQLNDWVFGELQPYFSTLGEDFSRRYKDYFASTEDDDISRRILSAAHFFATRWEFNIVQHLDPDGYEMKEIREGLDAKMDEYRDLIGIRRITYYSKVRDFIDLCGQLRFQVRWSNLHRAPRTSVLGHELIVAIVSYLLSLQMNACIKRRCNNFFTGLFHDFPEVLTRDIISPIKEVAKLDELIKDYETQQMEQEVYGLIPDEWHDEMQRFTEKEFENNIIMDSKFQEKTSDEINKSYNEDKYSPRDGDLIDAVDKLSAFVEAYLAKKYGIKHEEFDNAIRKIREKYASKVIGGIDLARIYEEFRQ